MTNSCAGVTFVTKEERIDDAAPLGQCSRPDRQRAHGIPLTGHRSTGWGCGGSAQGVGSPGRRPRRRRAERESGEASEASGEDSVDANR